MIGLVKRLWTKSASPQRIQVNEERLRFALEGSNDGLWDWNLASGDLYLSPRWKDMLGYGDAELANSMSTWEALIHPHDLTASKRKFAEHLAAPDQQFEMLHRLRHKNGAWRWILARGRVVLDPETGQPQRMVGTQVDITEQKQLEQTLRAEREKVEVTLASIGEAVISTDARGRIEFINPVASSLSQWSPEEAEGRDLTEVFAIIDERTRQPADNPVQGCLEHGRVTHVGDHALLVARDGREISVESSASTIYDDAGQLVGAVLVFRDVSEARQLQRQLEYQAQHDELTGLWNRRAFNRKLAELTSSALHGRGEHILVYIDLDQFKIVNDTAGHLAGDELLKQVANLLFSELRASDVPARLGGDEFGLLLADCELAEALRICEQLRSRLAEYRFGWQSQSFQVAASIGVVVMDADLLDPNPLALADLACYAAKDQGRNRIHVYHPDDHDLSERRSQMEWVAKIKKALDEDRLVLFGQRIRALDPDLPATDMREILVRMRDENGDLVLPSQFIPAAERYAIMSAVDIWVFDRACAWLEQPANHAVHVSINLSGGSLSDNGLIEAIEHRLDHRPSLHQRICFEITETAAIGNLSDALKFMQRLKGKGVRFSLDDFGSGLSSFGYLKTLPVDYIKIDGTFIRDLLDDPFDAVVVECIARLSRQLRIQTVAEFVENDTTLARLVKMGVDYAQGYAVERPQPLA